MAKSWCLTDRAGKTPILSTAVLALLLFSISASASETYTPWPGEFLRMGAGARAMGMGNAYTAIEGDVYSTYFNPAGLAALEGKELALSVSYLPFDRRFMYLGYGTRIGPDADFGFTWIQSGTDDIIGRDLNGNPTGTLEDKRNSLAVTFAKSVGKRISIGLNTKLTLWRLGSDDARTFGFDAGAVIRPLDHLTCSVVLRDIRSRFIWTSDRWKKTISGADGQSSEKDDDFPLYYTLGAAYRLLQNRVTLSATAELLEDNPNSYNMGASYTLTDRLTFRGGLYHYTAEDELDMGSLTAGMTLVLTASSMFDYAYVPDDFSGDSIHLISFTLSYGE